MRSPIVAATGNLAFTVNGTVWATWRLAPQAYGMRPLKYRHAARNAHTALFRAINGEGLLLGLLARMDPAAVVERMIEGVDLARHPGWAAEAEARLDELETMPLGQRTFWLSVPLVNESKEMLMAPVRSWWSTLADLAALPRSGPGRALVAQRLAQAEALRAELPSVFAPRPATVAEQLWIHLQLMQRGTAGDQEVPVLSDGSVDAETLTIYTGAGLPSPILDEGGQSDLARKSTFNPFKRKFVKITDPVTDLVSYQQSSIITGTPVGGLSFPGGEWLGRIDESGVEVDWALRFRVRAGREVRARNAKALRNLNDQYDQQDDPGLSQSSLGVVAGALAEYEQEFASDENEVEVAATTILTVAGATGESTMQQGRALREFMTDVWDFRLATEPGLQEELWHACVPGNPTRRVALKSQQITTSRAFSAAVPVMTSSLGDPAGVLVALGLGGIRVSPVLLDFDGAASRLHSAIAVGVCGELGSGKSVLLKSPALSILARGGQCVAIDRSPPGEWEQAFAVVEGQQTISISPDATTSLDPLRTLPPAAAATVTVTQSFVTALLRIPVASVQGMLLSEVLDPAYRQSHTLRSMADVVGHLSAHSDPQAAELGRRIKAFANLDLARAIFDPSLPAAELTAPALVVRTHELTLPSKDELTIRHLYEELPLEKILGRAIYTLAIATARRICFRDRSRLAFLFLDEAHSATISPEAERETSDWLRDGRKN